MPVRILWLALPAITLEAGWLALWPLSAALSHSPAFTTEFVAAREPAARLLEIAHPLAQRFLPNLPATPMLVVEPLGSPALIQPALGLAWVLLWLAAAYVLGLIVLDRWLGQYPLAAACVVAAAIVYQVTLAFLPGLFSQDVFSYIAYGRLGSIYDLNPYIWPPSAIAKDAILPWVAEVWRAYPAPYGPVWLDVQSAMAWIFREASVADQALAYRALGNVLLLTNLGLAWLLLRRLTRLNRGQRTTALAALAWNPLVLFEVAASAHNDVLMVTFTLAALLLLARSSDGVLAVASLSMATLVKFLSGLGLMWVAIATLKVSGRPARVAVLAACSIGVALLLVWPWLELPDSLEPLFAETAGVGYVNALPDTLVLAAWDHVADRDAARTLERLLIVVGFGSYLIWEARRVLTEASVAAVARACARSTLIYVLVVSTSVQAWYFVLPVTIAAVLGCSTSQTRITISYALLALPVLSVYYYLRELTPGWMYIVYGTAPLLWLVPAVRTRMAHRRRSDSSLQGLPAGASRPRDA
jgi:hypothetical protein